jgi:predicted esterase
MAASPGEDAASQLVQAFSTAYRAGDWPSAVAIGTRLAALEPDQPVHRYNLACACALAGDADQAVAWLGRAAAGGFWRSGHLARDPDLDSVRGRAGFAAAASAVERNHKAVREVVAERFAAKLPVLVTPPDHDPMQPAPLVVVLHGYGDRADGYPTLWRGAAARAGAALVIPQGVRKAGPGYTWQDPDEAGLILDLTLEWTRRQVAIDGWRLVLTGFSQGGFIAMVLGVRHPELFVGVIPMAGGYLSETDAPPPASTIGAPGYYFMVGALDRAAGALRRAADDFSAAGYRVRLRVLPGTGHSFPRDTDRELGKALRFALGDASP